MRKYFIVILIFATVISIAATLDLNNTYNYENQNIPTYFTKDNTTPGNDITDLGATLGRVLFYDKKLSLNNSISCASCHIQEFAFGDTAKVSVGFDGGLTARHSMRLVNARFGDEPHFFWDERAATLEEQSTMPIQDHVEMGFSGFGGQPGFDSLVDKLNAVSYYPDLFEAAFGDPGINTNRIQLALAQFVRSIHSFDSKYDEAKRFGLDDAQPFFNYTSSENNGKFLFMNPQQLGGAGCVECHRAPEFDIDPLASNNGVIAVANSPGSIDLNNTRAPTLRDLFNPSGDLNTPLMHNGEFETIEEVIDHYNQIPQDPNNTNLDSRLFGPSGDLQLTATEKTDLINFLKTLSGTDVYTNPKWSDPFDSQGNLTVVPLIGASISELETEFNVYPNPFQDKIQVSLSGQRGALKIFSINGSVVYSTNFKDQQFIDLSSFQNGIYIMEIILKNGIRFTKKIVKQ